MAKIAIDVEKNHKNKPIIWCSIFAQTNTRYYSTIPNIVHHVNIILLFFILSLSLSLSLLFVSLALFHSLSFHKRWLLLIGAKVSVYKLPCGGLDWRLRFPFVGTRHGTWVVFRCVLGLDWWWFQFCNGFDGGFQLIVGLSLRWVSVLMVSLG